jgi:hypothetical protein
MSGHKLILNYILQKLNLSEKEYASNAGLYSGKVKLPPEPLLSVSKEISAIPTLYHIQK